MKANLNNRHQRNRVLAVLALAGTMVALAPATQAHAFEVVKFGDKQTQYRQEKSADGTTYTIVDG